MKKHFELIENSGLKPRFAIPILFNISLLPDIQANQPETSQLFDSKNGFGEHLFFKC